ncbi:MAG: hypothetical protein P8016_03970 [Sedimentisphaerales bacterium]
MIKNTGNLVPKLYYSITPAFILLDYIWGINIRVSVLDNYQLYKGLYYGFCILCGVIIFLIPRSSPFVALIESIIILMMIVLGIFMPYIQSLRESFDILNDDFEKICMTSEHVINFVLAGLIAVFTFHKGLEELGLEKK